MRLGQAEVERVRRIVGSGVVDAHRVSDRGYAPNMRWVVRTEDGRSVFVKYATDRQTASWLRAEHAVYRRLRGKFFPQLLGWDDDGESPVLVLEDLSDAVWPPPWTPDAVDAVLAALEELHGGPTPAGLGALDATQYAEDGWPEVARRPEPLLSLGLCTAAWLDRALPVLVAAASLDALAGDATLHLDVRSDNLCLRDGRAVLFDWNHAAVGNPQFDIAFWLPSLRAEGGPEPEEVADLDPAMSAHVSGFFAARAGLPVIPTAPGVRAIQLVQLRTALPWAARALDLPPLDGPNR
ncbi:phosphotransferase [Saccharothrix australiensis]|uniref:Phosphotransferase family enzyme n=1 Tax=Saccharothrix australiensis TaxID=2072 RepID=A0A495VX64_9PSEU|nr:phosphotransferase [Saccharothrix australiensis]RKT53839.1 phosphotransferase family enzyme [Saccharothrix australiensis]